VAESDTPAREGSDTWDGSQSPPTDDTFLTFSADIDGTSFDVLSFAATGGNNSGPAADTDCDGVGEGAAVTAAFSTVCVQLPSTGNNMDLSFTIGGMNTDGDDVALDNIFVICTDDATTLPAALTASCTAPVLPPTAAVPTMSEWAVILLSILMIIMATLSFSLVGKPAMATPSGHSVNTKFKLSNLPFERNLFLRMTMIALVFILALFTLAIQGFGYELTNADPTGSIFASFLIGYWLMLLKMEKED